jgi:hypothetical protein
MILDTSATIALYIVLVFVLIFALVTVGLLGAVAFALNILHKQFESVLVKADPVIVRVNDVLVTVQKVTSNVGEKADDILTKGETIVDGIADKVEGTATVVQQTVTKPLISFSSLLAAIIRAFSNFTGSARSSNGRK